jgi:hypothetical protein
MPGMLHVTVTAQPVPINIDTLSFSLSFDGDLLQLGTPTTDCTGENPLCNYDVQFDQPADGSMNFKLIRQDRNILAAFADTAATINVPFTTFVARHNSTVVSVVGLSSTLTSPSVANGLVSIGSQCSDPTLRAYLNENLLAAFGSVTPNPASHSATATIIASRSDLDATISIIDRLGNTVRRVPVRLAKGSNPTELEVGDLASGNYVLALSVGSKSSASVPLVILR